MPKPTSEDLAEALKTSRGLVSAEARGVAAVEDLVETAEFRTFLGILLDTDGKVITSAAGTSGAVARRLAHLLSVCGTPALYLHPTEGLHGSLGAVAPGDIVIALSKGGGTGELTEFAARAKARGARILVMTSRNQSPLSEVADDVAIIPAGEGDPGGAIAMGSTLAMASWGDALAISLMQLRGYTWEQFLFTHPAGKVGEDAEEILSRVGN
ncbi:SIS domain-containing protein [Tessaracoccus caeni]|uniref:SIS domain-containing protein n=1 Tax=Tessaracoccus caeni TaxID=3031239 RepID=UPI0023DBF23D|nr:SIS domain-containing protein [Tessaracoccus caeni]MDF1487927.1 SIS domain-containing protein [Tessaracoccus caeni]